MTPTVKILDRIKKLLAMAQGRGGSANEVAVAAAEAARLMQLHKLTEADIPTDAAEGPDMVDLPAGADFLDSWRFVLVTCVARSFMCETIGLRSAGRRKVRVVGRREDVEVALEVYRHLAGEIDRLTEEYQGDDLDTSRGWGDLWDDIFGAAFGPVDRHTAYEHMRGEGRPAIDPARREVYRDGLVAGIATKLKEQKVVFEESGEKALVVARKSKEEIRSYLATKFVDPNQKIVSASPQPASHDEVDFARGFMRGQQVVVDQPVKPGKQEKQEEKKVEDAKKKVVVQKWEESERGWGTRPDGYSIHPDEEARARYVKAYWDRQPDETPDEYSRPHGTPYEAEVDAGMEIEGDGRRFYEHESKGYPGDGGPDGWKRG